MMCDYFFSSLLTEMRRRNALSQHFSPELCLEEAQAQGGNMIYNLSLLMSRQSVSMCCVYVHMFLWMCVGVCVFSFFPCLPKQSLKVIFFNHQSHHVFGNKIFSIFF